jgi:hypothetical protein
MNKFTQSRKRLSPLLIFCTTTLLLLGACGSQPGPTSASSTPEPTVTTSSTVPPGTPRLTQQYEFTNNDSGKTATYTVTSRFTIILNTQQYPKGNLQVSCHPAGTLGAISNLPSEAPPLYAVRYEGVQPGICTIKNGTFLLTVKIIALSSASEPIEANGQGQG